MTNEEIQTLAKIRPLTLQVVEKLLPEVTKEVLFPPHVQNISMGLTHDSERKTCVVITLPREHEEEAVDVPKELKGIPVVVRYSGQPRVVEF